MRGKLLLAIVSAWLGTPVLAADSPATADASPDAGARPDTDSGAIVVTAQLRAQNALDVPIALTAYSGDFLQKLGIYEFDKLGTYVPGLLVQNQSPNDPGFVIRGITSDSGTAYNEPRVSIFENGVSISKSRGSYVELFDLERVEIAKGPQSTLYGRGALIGAINLVEAKADPAAQSFYERVSYGNFRAIQADATVNLPITDHVAVRVAGRYKIRDGYVADDLGGDAFNSQKTAALRAAFHADAGDAISLDVIGNYEHDAPTGISFKSIAYAPNDPTTGAIIGTRGRNSGAALAPAAGFENGRGLGVDRNVYGVTGLIKWTLSDDLTLNSITGLRKFDAEEVFDGDGLSLPLLTAAEDARDRQFSQELRLTYDSRAVTAFVGGSYFREKGSQRTPDQIDEREALARLDGELNGGPGFADGRAADVPAPASLFDNTAFTTRLVEDYLAARGVAIAPATAAGIAANLKPGHLETATNASRTRSYDLFGDVTLHITDRLDLGGGVRYSHDDKRSGFTAAVLNGRSVLGSVIGGLSLDPGLRSLLYTFAAQPGYATANNPFIPPIGLAFQPITGGPTSQTLTDSGFAFRGTLRYKPTDDTSIYATYARGRRPEVLSASAPGLPGMVDFTTLPSEKVDSYEIGAKASLLDHKLYADGAVYYYDYRNFGTTVQEGTLLVDTNAGRARSYGFEGQLNYTPTGWLRLFATYSYNHSRFRDGAYKGDHFRLTPDHSGSLGATMTIARAHGSFDLTPSITAQSRVFFDDDNDRPDLQTLAGGALVADTIQDEVQGAYAVVNLRIGYTFAGGRLRVEAWADNLLDRKYVKDAGNTGDALGLPTFIAGNPRFYGGALSYKFGGR